MRNRDFEAVLDELASELTERLRHNQRAGTHISAKDFESEVRATLREVCHDRDIYVDMTPPAQEFPDIIFNDQFGIEVKYTENDTWRSIANSIFEGRRNLSVKEIYIIFGKAGGLPEVRWARYENCIMHVRTSHVPRFEIEIGTDRPLFEKLKVSYDTFRLLPQHEKMVYIREYAKGRLKPGERLWWIEDLEEQGEQHSLPLEVKLYTQLEQHEKRKLRAEAAFLCPQIVQGSRTKGKYDDATLYILTRYGILCNQARDLFTAGSVAMRGNDERGGNYLQRALDDIEQEIRFAARTLNSEVVREYWGFDVPVSRRIREWMRLLDENASGTGWIPSEELFKGLTRNWH